MRKLFVLCLVALAAACAQEPADNTSVSSEEPTVMLGESAGDSYLQGHLFDVADIDNFADVVEFNGNSNYQDIVSYVPHENGKAMSIVNVYSGNFNSPEFEPGTTRTFNYLGNEDTDIRVTVTGCLFEVDAVGPYYDDPADEVEIFTEMLNNNVKRVNYIARWLDGSDNVTDEFHGFINVNAQ